MKIGLVGLGRMGAAIAQRLAERGCEVAAWDRNPKAREAQVKRGLRIVDSPRAVADEADLVLCIITEDKGVRQIFIGPDGFLSAEIKGKLFIEMSTLQPMTHRELAPVVKARGAHLVDSPVMGSIPTVREGRLLALLGGDAADVERARSVLISMKSLPLISADRNPSGPAKICRTPLSSVMMESTTSASSATARGLSTILRPRLACASRALGLRSQAVTSQPRSLSRCAIAAPIRPRPTRPIFI